MNIVLLLATVVTLPLLVPRGPGNTAPVDAFAVAFLLLFLATVIVRRRQVRLPGALPILAIMLVSSVAVLFSVGPRTGLLSLVIELYLALLFWCAANELVGRPDRMRMFAAVWVGAAVLWAGLLIATHFGLFSSGLQRALLDYDVSGRSAGATRNPNLAADYLVTSLFVLVASPVPKRMWIRLVTGAWLVFAIWTSGSIGALLALAAGAAVIGVGAAARRGGGRGRVALSAAAVLLIGGIMVGAVALPPDVNTTTVSQVAQNDSGGVFSDSLGRVNRSVNSRLDIWSSAWGGGAQKVLVGVGPNEAPDIVVDGAPLGKGLHNDFLAFLFERGILGLICLLVFVSLILRWCGTLMIAGRVRIGGYVWRTSAVAAAVVANLVFALTHEAYHFRHLWLILALLWAVRDGVLARAARPAPVLRPVVVGRDRAGATV